MSTSVLVIKSRLFLLFFLDLAVCVGLVKVGKLVEFLLILLIFWLRLWEFIVDVFLLAWVPWVFCHYFLGVAFEQHACLVILPHAIDVNIRYFKCLLATIVIKFQVIHFVLEEVLELGGVTCSFGFDLVGHQLEVGHHWLVVREVHAVNAVVIQLVDTHISFPKYAVAVGGDPLFLWCVVRIAPLVVLISWFERYLAFLEVTEEHILKLVFHGNLLMRLEFLESEI